MNATTILVKMEEPVRTRMEVTSVNAIMDMEEKIARKCLTYVKKILVRMEERAEATKEDIHAAVSHNGLEKIASKM